MRHVPPFSPRLSLAVLVCARKPAQARARPLARGLATAFAAAFAAAFSSFIAAAIVRFRVMRIACCKSTAAFRRQVPVKRGHRFANVANLLRDRCDHTLRFCSDVLWKGGFQFNESFLGGSAIPRPHKGPMVPSESDGVSTTAGASIGGPLPQLAIWVLTSSR